MKITQKNHTIATPSIKDYSFRGAYIPFGDDNMFLEHLLEIHNDSPVQSIITTNLITYVMGGSLEVIGKSQPNYYQTWQELLELLYNDYVTLGSFAIQVVQTKANISIFHQPITQVRIEKINEFGEPISYLLNSDWSKGRRTAKSITATPNVEGEPYLLYYHKKNLDGSPYGLPRWVSAKNWVAADGNISKYYNNFISNNFSANLSIAYPNNPDDKTKEEIYNALSYAFGGADNAGSVLLMFGESGTLPKVESIQSTSADLYNTVNNLVTQNIITANGIITGQLFGINDASGFSSQSDMLVSAYNLLKLTVVDKLRWEVAGRIEKLCGVQFKFEDYNLVAENEGDTIANDIIENQ